jgi:hypothetical protein
MVISFFSYGAQGFCKMVDFDEIEKISALFHTLQIIESISAETQ